MGERKPRKWRVTTPEPGWPGLVGVVFQAVAVNWEPFQCQIRVRFDDGKQCGSPGWRTPRVSRMSEPTGSSESAPSGTFSTGSQAVPVSRNTSQASEMPQDGIETIETIAWLPAPRNGPQNVFPIGVLPIVGSTKKRAVVADCDAASAVQGATEIAADGVPAPVWSASAAAESAQPASTSRSRVRMNRMIARNPLRRQRRNTGPSLPPKGLGPQSRP